MDLIGVFLKLLELQNFIILSLILQCSLVFLSPLRKNISSPAVTTFLWLEYTAASLSADYAVGLISVSSSTTPSVSHIVSLWAPFTFLQVVGPDTITAFSIEETKSSFRTSFRLLLTGIAVNRAMITLFPKKTLAVAAICVGLAGAAKFYETIHCLFVGNLTRFRTFTKPFHYPHQDDPDLPPLHQILPNASDHNYKLTDADVARDSFGFFKTFKGIFANVVFTPQQCSFSRSYFLARDAKDAFAVVETELNFAYDIFYTKKIVLTWRLGRYFRLMTIVFEFVAFFIWVSVDKHEFGTSDIRITYILFLSALVLEFIFFFIHKLSNWTIGSLLLRKKTSFWVKLISLKNKLGFVSRRWSGSVSRYSLIMRCTSNCSSKVDKVLSCLKIKDLVYGFWNMSPMRFDSKLRDLLFNEIKYRSLKAENLDDAKQMSFSRGDWILRDYYHNNPSVLTFADAWFVESMEFNKIVLLWHVATELCYYVYNDGGDDEEKERRKYSKVISDYMAYILIRQPTMLSKVAGEVKTTFENTCDEVAKMLTIADLEGLKDKVEKACRILIMENSDEVEFVPQKKESSVLEDARKLSKELKALMDEGIDMWEMMSKVWVELMCYAASNCKASEHAGQLCKGGQLLTILWLLMAHLGLTNRFELPN